MKIDGVTVKSEEQILAALQEEFDQIVEFVVMDNGKDFIQTSGGALEYQEGGKHYFVADNPVDQEKIKAAFLSYYRGDGEYLRNFEWSEEVYESLWTKIKKLFGK